MEIEGGIILFTEEKQTELHIGNDGVITVHIITSYYKDKVKIGEDHWQQAMVPDPVYVNIAGQILDEYHLNIVRSVWTDEVMQKFAELQNDSTATL